MIHATLDQRFIGPASRRFVIDATILARTARTNSSIATTGNHSRETVMPRIDTATVPERKGSGYPPPYAAFAGERRKQALGDAGGLTDFGVNLTHLPAGAWSSQRHWHSHEDEFVYVLSGELVLLSDAGEQVLRAGDCAAFPRNVADGHHLINRSGEMAVYLEIGSRSNEDACSYPDIDLHLERGADRYSHKDGTPYA
ncbi:MULTISPECIES: cupin domain-containing protein [Rhodanobacter]|uniref:cupin domain-containing protein n=1 Tax=Rhodanobacter TaxID=75309 RepID=UPI001F43AC4B|nr:MULTISPECIES: cupin domain-containing protein [Rhodanobacter]UJJ53868.1 cupin domain-containing protein [Rhodanobacter thiooxydans]